MSMQEYEEMLKERRDVYHLLSRLFLREMDEELLTRLQRLPERLSAGNADFERGWGQMTAFVRHPDEDVLTELAADYARIFLGAGCVDETVAYPFESVYTSPQKLVAQDAYEQVVVLFRREGLAKIDQDLFEDHAALEFSFMRHCCERALTALQQDSQAEFDRAMQAQGDFLQTHLLNWIPRWCGDIAQCPGTAFYGAVGLLTQGFLQLEQARFQAEA